MESGKLIAVYGIDGTGKTTTAENLHSRLVGLGERTVNFDTFKDSGNYTKNPYRKLDTGNLETQCASYFTSMSHHSDQIGELISRGNTVIKSRYIRDIRAHFSHLGVSEDFLDDCEQRNNFIFPDMHILLMLDESTRRERLLKRGNLDANDMDEFCEGSRAHFFQAYLQPIATLSINTGEKTPNEVVDIILKTL